MNEDLEARIERAVNAVGESVAQLVHDATETLSIAELVLEADRLLAGLELGPDDRDLILRAADAARQAAGHGRAAQRKINTCLNHVGEESRRSEQVRALLAAIAERERGGILCWEATALLAELSTGYADRRDQPPPKPPREGGNEP